MLHEPLHIFTNSLNSIYLIKMQIKYPSLYNNHPNKTILKEFVTQLEHRLQSLIIYKVKAHSNIQSNEIVGELAKDGRHLIHSLSLLQYEHAHLTSYFLHKDKWKGIMARTPYKRHVRHLQRYFIKYKNETYLRDLVENFSNINKWTNDENIEQISSNNF